MNFVNKLVSKITVILSFVLVFFQVYISLNKDSKDLFVFIASIIVMVLAIAALVYVIVLCKKYNKNYQTKLFGNECAMNLLIASTAVVLSILSFVLTYVAYLNLIFM